MSDLNWDTLYTDHADAYEILVSHEDYQNNLIAAIQNLQPLSGSTVAEFGAGTGRVTGLLAGRVRHISSFDFSEAMLRVAQGRQRGNNWSNVSLALATAAGCPLVPVGRISGSKAGLFYRSRSGTGRIGKPSWGGRWTRCSG